MWTQVKPHGPDDSVHLGSNTKCVCVFVGAIEGPGAPCPCGPSERLP